MKKIIKSEDKKDDKVKFKQPLSFYLCPICNGLKNAKKCIICADKGIISN